MITDVPTEADWDLAPSLLDGAQELTLTAQQCDLASWLGHSDVAHDLLRRRSVSFPKSGDVRRHVSNQVCRSAL